MPQPERCPGIVTNATTRTMSKAPESKKQTRRSLMQIGFLHLSKISIIIMWLFRLVSQMTGTPDVFAREPPGRVELPGFLFGLFACGPSSPLKTTAPPAIKNSKDFFRDTLFPSVVPQWDSHSIKHYKGFFRSFNEQKYQTGRNYQQVVTMHRSEHKAGHNDLQMTSLGFPPKLNALRAHQQQPVQRRQFCKLPCQR